MKRLILVSIASLLLSSTYASAEWVKPTKSECGSYGGNLENGICKAKWQYAKDICQALQARLPTIMELEKVITDCGGVVGDFNNRKNLKYQECYQRRGFSNKDLYFSSTETNNYSSRALSVSFYHGFDHARLKLDGYYVLCIR